MLVHPSDLPASGRRFDAMLVWMSERPLDRQKSYLLKHTTQLVRADVEQVACTMDLETLKQIAREPLDAERHRPRHRRLPQADLLRPLPRRIAQTGAFILIDSLSNNTVAAGMILEGEAAEPYTESQRPPALERAGTQVSHDERSERLGQKGCTVWLTGLPASGKSAIAFALERRLFDLKRLAMVVDPDDGISKGRQPLGSSPWQTPELARRTHRRGAHRDLRLRVTVPLGSRGHPRRRRCRTLRRDPRRARRSRSDAPATPAATTAPARCNRSKKRRRARTSSSPSTRTTPKKPRTKSSTSS